MKKYTQLFIALLTAFVFYLIFLSCNDLREDPERSLTGYITVVGNEPFTELALNAEDVIYILDCGPETKAELWRMQGSKVIIYYRTLTIGEYGHRTVKVIRYAVWRQI